MSIYVKWIEVHVNSLPGFPDSCRVVKNDVDRIIRETDSITHLSGVSATNYSNAIRNYWKFFKAMRDAAFLGISKQNFLNGLNGGNGMSPEQWKTTYNCNTGSKKSKIYRNVQGECMQVVSKNSATNTIVSYNSCGVTCCTEEYDICYDPSAPNSMRITKVVKSGDLSSWIPPACTGAINPILPDPTIKILPCINWCEPTPTHNPPQISDLEPIDVKKIKIKTGSTNNKNRTNNQK